jgi:hypothetical protein
MKIAPLAKVKGLCHATNANAQPVKLQERWMQGAPGVKLARCSVTGVRAPERYWRKRGGFPTNTNNATLAVVLAGWLAQLAMGQAR